VSKTWRGRNSKRGASEGEADHRTGATHLRVEQSLVVEEAERGSCFFGSGERGADNGKGAVLPDEGRSLHGGKSPWTG
jgi:hypothetical protein